MCDSTTKSRLRRSTAMPMGVTICGLGSDQRELKARIHGFRYRKVPIRCSSGACPAEAETGKEKCQIRHKSIQRMNREHWQGFFAWCGVVRFTGHCQDRALTGPYQPRRAAHRRLMPTIGKARMLNPGYLTSEDG